jgi:hypothetical protein
MSDESTRSMQDELLDRFRVALLEPAPDDVTQAAVALHHPVGTTPRPMQVSYDSVFEGVPVGVRGAGPRTISFDAGAHGLEIEVDSEGTWRVLGQLVPPAPGEARVESALGSRVVPIDEAGRFLADVAPGPLRIVVETAGQVTETSWITL